MDKPKGKVTIASLVYSMIKEGKGNEVIIKSIKKKFPESKINESHLSWYRNQLALESKPKTKDAVKKVSKKPAKEVKDNEDEDVDEKEDDEDEEDEVEEEDDDK